LENKEEKEIQINMEDNEVKTRPRRKCPDVKNKNIKIDKFDKIDKIPEGYTRRIKLYEKK
jgi:hypothetical protein